MSLFFCQHFLTTLQAMVINLEAVQQTEYIFKPDQPGRFPLFLLQEQPGTASNNAPKPTSKVVSSVVRKATIWEQCCSTCHDLISQSMASFKVKYWDRGECWQAGEGREMWNLFLNGRGKIDSCCVTTCQREEWRCTVELELLGR